jgi:hypothetical protein
MSDTDLRAQVWTCPKLPAAVQPKVAELIRRAALEALDDSERYVREEDETGSDCYLNVYYILSSLSVYLTKPPTVQATDDTDLRAQVAADLGLLEPSVPDRRLRAVLELVVEALHLHNLPTGPGYERIIELGHAACLPDSSRTDIAEALRAWNRAKDQP